MPAMLDDPDSPALYRVSGQPPFPDPQNPVASLPLNIRARYVTLRDRHTLATVIPFASCHQVPPSLLAYLCDQLNKEIEGGDTYPMVETMSVNKFACYWFQNFGAIMLLGHIGPDETGPGAVLRDRDWSVECLGSFYIKPNYPGRSSHVCNAGFIVTDQSRNRGAGRLMGETYIEWAPRLGYTYSVFNLVYETNVVSCKLWDALGFKRIGRVRSCGNLRSYPDRLVDAIIYGRGMSMEEADKMTRSRGAGGAVGQTEELGNEVSDDRFDKIKYYLRYGEYPKGSNRAEKSRLRAASTHYKLLDDKLMLKGKEVIPDPKEQTEIVKTIHEDLEHAGINKTTTATAERYHWGRIKETVSEVVRRCTECRDHSKAPVGLAMTALRDSSSVDSGYALATVRNISGNRDSGGEGSEGRETTRKRYMQQGTRKPHHILGDQITSCSQLSHPRRLSPPDTGSISSPSFHNPSHPSPSSQYPTLSISSIAPSRTMHSPSNTPVHSIPSNTHSLISQPHHHQNSSPQRKDSLAQESTHTHSASLLSHIVQQSPPPPPSNLLVSPTSTPISLYSQPLDPHIIEHHSHTGQHHVNHHHHHHQPPQANPFSFHHHETRQERSSSEDLAATGMENTMRSDIESSMSMVDVEAEVGVVGVSPSLVNEEAMEGVPQSVVTVPVPNGMIGVGDTDLTGVSQPAHLDTYPEPDAFRVLLGDTSANTTSIPDERVILQGHHHHDISHHRHPPRQQHIDGQDQNHEHSHRQEQDDEDSARAAREAVERDLDMLIEHNERIEEFPSSCPQDHQNGEPMDTEDNRHDHVSFHNDQEFMDDHDNHNDNDDENNGGDHDETAISAVYRMISYHDTEKNRTINKTVSVRDKKHYEESDLDDDRSDPIFDMRFGETG